MTEKTARAQYVKYLKGCVRNYRHRIEQWRTGVRQCKEPCKLRSSLADVPNVAEAVEHLLAFKYVIDGVTAEDSKATLWSVQAYALRRMEALRVPGRWTSQLHRDRDSFELAAWILVYSTVTLSLSTRP